MINAVIPIWKPVDWTSFDVVKKIRSLIKPDKVGHAGTLDPFAEGVLMICTGNKTKSIECFMNQEKEYIGEIIFGNQTDTLDRNGKVVKTSDIPKLDEKQIQDILADFIGVTMQEPPMYSALKYYGQPLYKLARMGINLRLKKREIKIYDIEIHNIMSDRIIIKARCGRGTYMRSLARDIAISLGTVGHLNSLKRTRIGDIDEKCCITLKEFPEWLSARI